MALFSGFNVSMATLDLLTKASIAAYVGGALPSGWSYVTPGQMGISQYAQSTNYYNNNGANAVLLKSGSSYILSFRGADNPNDFDQLDPAVWLALFKPFLDAAQNVIPSGATIYVTGSSLGGTAANMLAEIAATKYPELSTAKFVAFAPLWISEKEGILNFGFENDPYYKWKSGYADFNSSMDNFVAATDQYMAGNYDGQRPWDLYAHWGIDVKWFANSRFLDVMTPDSVVFIYARNGQLVQDITPGRENVGVFYLGSVNNDIIAGRNGPDYLEGFNGHDNLRGNNGNDHISGGLGNDLIDGGTGTDTAYFTGLASQYTITRQSYAQYTVTGPDGTDVLTRVEKYQFNDKVVSKPAFGNDLEGAALEIHKSMVGAAPTDAALDNLIDFAALQRAYGASIGTPDPMLYTWQALGQAMSEASPAFDYLGRAPSDAEFVNRAYVDAFGVTPTLAQTTHFVNQVNYFENLYNQSGAYGSPDRVELLARGAVYGQMLGISADMDLLT